MEVENNAKLVYFPPESSGVDNPNYRCKVIGILRCMLDECELSRGAEIKELGATEEATILKVYERSQVYVNTFCLEQSCQLPEPD